MPDTDRRIPVIWQGKRMCTIRLEEGDALKSGVELLESLVQEKIAEVDVDPSRTWRIVANEFSDYGGSTYLDFFPYPVVIH